MRLHLKIFLLLTGLLLFACAANAQGSVIPDEPTLARQLALGRELYSLGHTYSDPRFYPKTPVEAVAIVRKAIAIPPARASKEETTMITRWQSWIDSLLYAFPTIASSVDTSYICDDFLTPARMARKDSSLCFILTGLASNAVYDSYSHTARERAQTILQSLVLPVMKAIGTFPDTTVRYVGVAVYYPTSASDTVPDVPEMLMIVSPRVECVKYSTEEITEDELLDRSDIFLADIDSPSDIRKVKLELQ